MFENYLKDNYRPYEKLKIIFAIEDYIDCLKENENKKIDINTNDENFLSWKRKRELCISRNQDINTFKTEKKEFMDFDDPQKF